MASLRIGIPLIGGTTWMGGVTYVEMLARSLSSLEVGRRPDLHLILTVSELVHIDAHASFLNLFQKIVVFSDRPLPSQIPPPLRARTLLVCADREQLYQHVDFCFPILSNVWEGFCAASWIPDFQHHHLPQFFSDEELAHRHRVFATIADRAKLLVLSSQTARQDFTRFYPQSTAATRVLPFFSFLDPSCFDEDPTETTSRYALPEKYLLCCNQFWVHKDHLTLLGALSRLRIAGQSIPLVCTGSPSDYRAPGYFETVLRGIDELGLSSQVRILGMLPRRDQIQLMRRSCALVQPSLFEGWSSVVEDAKALGKMIFLSDLPVHREQAPPGATFFKAGDPIALAQAMSERFDALPPGPQTDAEARARAAVTDRMRQFADGFMELVGSARQLYPGQRPASRDGVRDQDHDVDCPGDAETNHDGS